MIKVTRLNKKSFYLNPDLIETMEQTPDTVITLTGGNKYVVTEEPTLLIQRIGEFRRRCHPDYAGPEERKKNET
ncbi:flagellar protein (FlbD) [Peptococcaceae bacterium CEB3]|nr:flagellar protein (FlbD) [Peptococcaceae bacterium CEB3]